MIDVELPDGMYSVEILKSYVKLLPCPFCAREASESSGNTDHGKKIFYYIECLVCAAMGPEADTNEEAIENWNIRVKQSPSPLTTRSKISRDTEC